MSPLNESGLGIEEEYKDNILDQIKKCLTREEHKYFCQHIKEQAMPKVTGERLQELYENTAGEFDDTSSRFAHMAEILNKECERGFLNELACMCEQQLSKMREEGM